VIQQRHLDPEAGAACTPRAYYQQLYRTEEVQ
jgi:hypothetical protein